jgi:hypothetical protein
VGSVFEVRSGAFLLALGGFLCACAYFFLRGVIAVRRARSQANRGCDKNEAFDENGVHPNDLPRAVSSALDLDYQGWLSLGLGGLVLSLPLLIAIPWDGKPPLTPQPVGKNATMTQKIGDATMGLVGELAANPNMGPVTYEDRPYRGPRSASPELDALFRGFFSGGETLNSQEVHAVIDKLRAEAANATPRERQALAARLRSSPTIGHLSQPMRRAPGSSFGVYNQLLAAYRKALSGLELGEPVPMMDSFVPPPTRQVARGSGQPEAVSPPPISRGLKR